MMSKCMSAIITFFVIVAFMLITSLLVVVIAQTQASTNPLDACIGRPDGKFVNNPQDCQSFWICNNERPLGGRCPAGYNFNPGTTLCDLPEIFPCFEGGEDPETTTVPIITPETEEPTTTVLTTVAPPTTVDVPTSTTVIIPTSTTTTTETQPPVIDNNVCLNRPNGHFVNNPANCQAYWICYDNEAFTGVCREDLNFNEADQVCDNPVNFPCTNAEDGQTTVMPSTTVAPATTLLPDNDGFRCPTAGIALYAIADSCTRFRFCFAGVSIAHECAVGLHFDEQKLRCDFEELAQCTRGLCPLTNDPANVVTHASRTSCENFYICYDGKMKPFRCAPGLQWNQQRRHCDFPRNVQCHIETPNTTPKPLVIECPAANVEGLHIIAHPWECGRFFICSLGIPFEQVCPGDLLFDPAVGTCNKPERVLCFADSR